MRLTLRTLLAYLDKTLEPHDAETLRVKIEESVFATDLVARIQAAIANENLTTPLAEAVGPLEDANVMGEYLDSTLTPEQIAEIERACLESDAMLAEAASCHQALAMALGKSTPVSQTLRERVHRLPEGGSEQDAASFSSLSIPPETKVGKAGESRAADLSPPESQAQPVVPVGKGDSGVSDAPTRLLNDDADAPTGTRSAAALAGVKRNVLAETTDLYGGSIRTSRITPWLVSLALAAVMLFALAQIFEPLLNRERTASDDAAVTPLLEAAVERAPAASSPDDVERTDSPPIQPDPQRQEPEAEPAVPSEPSSVDLPDTPDSPKPLPSGRSPTETEPGPIAAADIAAADLESAPPTPELEPESVPDVLAGEIAKLLTEGSIVMAQTGDQPWKWLAKDDLIPTGSLLVCPPMYRVQLTTEAEVDLTLLGPARVRLEKGPLGEVIVAVESGRVLLEANQVAASLIVQLGSVPYRCGFPDPESLVAMEVVYNRPPGKDPRVPQNREQWGVVTTAVGAVHWTPLADPTAEDELQPLTIETGWQWIGRDSSQSDLAQIEVMPAWVMNQEPPLSSIDRGARDGLLTLISNEPSLELSLRQAIGFRRVEVGALAAQTLLLLDSPDVFFGGDGVLNQDRHRNYWSIHFWALQAAIDRSADSALEIDAAIEQMSAADHSTLFQLLVGFSQPELAAGGDAELVELLSSPSMAVRVLAIENLRRITGTTLYFKPWETNPNRRDSDARKWQVPLRRGDIRWPVEEPAVEEIQQPKMLEQDLNDERLNGVEHLNGVEPQPDSTGVE